MLYRYRDNQVKLWGFKDEHETVVIYPAFYDAFDFEGSVAAVFNGTHWGLMNQQQEMVLPFTYDSVYTSSTGWVHAKKGETHYLFHPNGALQLSLTDIISWYYPTEDIIRVKKDTGWGFIDMDGQTIIPFIYKSLGPCINGHIAFFENNKWGYINKQGVIVLEATFDETGVWNDQLYWARKDGHYQLYNYNHEVVLDEGWQKIIPPTDGQAAVKTSEGWNYIEDNFVTILQLPAEYERVTLFTHEYARVNRKGKWGYINRTGDEAIRCAFDKAEPFCEELAAVRINGRWGYIDTGGQLVIPCRFHEAGNFKNGRAWVCDNWYSWYINKKGEAVTEEVSLDEYH